MNTCSHYSGGYIPITDFWLQTGLQLNISLPGGAVSDVTPTNDTLEVITNTFRGHCDLRDLYLCQPTYISCVSTLLRPTTPGPSRGLSGATERNRSDSLLGHRNEEATTTTACQTIPVLSVRHLLNPDHSGKGQFSKIPKSQPRPNPHQPHSNPHQPH